MPMALTMPRGATPLGRPGARNRRGRRSGSSPAYGGMPGMLDAGAAVPGAMSTPATSPRMPGNTTAVGPGTDTGRGNQHTTPSQGPQGPMGAAGAMDFLRDSATAYSETLMPGLRQGLALTRSRFGGGGINSGAAQMAEEDAFSRLFANPLQQRISQLGQFALGFGENQRQFGMSHGLRTSYLDLANREHSESIRQFNELQSEREEERKASRWRGVGRLLGVVGGGIVGGLVGGPAGALAGAGIGGNALGGGD